jgi:hypothetical protein
MSSEWVVLIDKLGIPVSVMIGMGFAFYKIVIWLGMHVVVPLKDKHMSFIDQLQELIGKIVTVQGSIDSKVQQINDKLFDDKFKKEK